LTDEALLSAGERDLTHDYRDQLDKATVLCFQAGYEKPEMAEIWKRLGVLAETKSFFVTDPKERFDLMAEATAHFGHSARLEFEKSTREFFDSGEAEPKAALSDPYLTDLIWLGRLRRGEVTLGEVYQRHAAENLEPSHRPEFWEERALFIQAKRDGAKEDTELAVAREDFKTLWGAMPLEVPWRGASDKFGPQKLKKIEVLEAWAMGLTTIASQRENREEAQGLFLEAMELYKLALKMPLDLFEFKALASQLDQAELLAPDNDSLLALWGLKDSVYQLITKKFAGDVSVWAAWGRDYYARSGRQSDYRVWLSYFKIAGEKFQRYVDLSPVKDLAFGEWGSLLEFNIYPDLAYLSFLEQEDRLVRINAVLDLALEKYRLASGLDPDRLTNLQALSRILLKISTFKAEGEFGELLAESNRLALLAISRDPDTPGAWLRRGFDYLAFMELGTPGFEAKSQLTAEAFSAFNQYLLSNSGQIDDLRKMADQVWRVAENMPGLRHHGLRLLVDICRRLISLEPREPDYRFALGISLYCLLATSPNWPDDMVFSDSLSTREAFEQALVNFETGLALLSESEREAPSLASLGLASDRTPLPRPWGWPNPGDREFLSPEPGAGATLMSAGFQDRFGTSVKMELSRLVNAAKPELLPPWYQYRLAALFRRVAASGYPTKVDQMAFFRLADLYLTSALEALSATREGPRAGPGPEAGPGPAQEPGPEAGAGWVRGPRVTLASLIHAERGLLFSEMSLLVRKDREYLLRSAEGSWELAESESPGSSRYSKARWAAWTEGKKALIPMLAHTVDEQTNLLWPSLGEARLEPAFRDLIDQHWFKTAWFGYDR
jgi:tetratricopeptide (TPR) repeat protein